MGTLLGLLSGALVLLYSIPLENSWPWLPIGMVLAAVLLFLINQWTHVTGWRSLVEAAEEGTAYLFDVVKKDPLQWFANLYLTFFPLLTLLILLFFFLPTALTHNQWVAVWLVGLGIGLDLLYSSSRQYLKFLNPFHLLEQLTRTANHDVENNKELELCNTIEAISEIAVKGVDNTNIGLPNEALDQLQQISRNFLHSSQRLGHPTSDQALGIADKITYTLYFLYQRIELIFQKALDQHLEPVCSAVITTLGKIAYHAAKFDISLSADPFHLIGRLAKKAQLEKMPDVGVKASITLLEVAKLVLDEVDVTYQELRDPFLVLVNDLHEIAKEGYRQDKEIDLELLRQPFRQIKELFATEKLLNHPDTPVIIAKADQALAEFDALELILKTVPPLPVLEEGEKNLKDGPKGQETKETKRT